MEYSLHILFVKTYVETGSLDWVPCYPVFEQGHYIRLHDSVYRNLQIIDDIEMGPTENYKLINQ